MAIFGNIDFDLIVQAGEKIRLDASSSFLSPDEAALVTAKIKPEATASFINLDITDIEKWFIDWVYTSVGSKTVTLEIDTGSGPVTFTKDLTVVSLASENLFSSDYDLKAYEPDIMKWLPKGRWTYNFIHRKVRDLILTEIYKNRITNKDGTKITKEQIVDISEVREWAVCYVLNLIFIGISNKPDDTFSIKASMYKKTANEYKNLSFNILGIDLNSDSQIDITEKLDIRSGSLIRR